MSTPSAPRPPRVSLLMPNRDNAPILDHVLERLALHTTYPDVELLVVDDGSTDGSLELLRSWRDSGRIPGLRLIEHEHTEQGVIAALNRGLAEATGELVVQLDADASIETPGWLERMVSLFCSDPRIGVVTARIVFDWGKIHTCGVDLTGPDGFHDRGARITERPGSRTYHQRVLRSTEQQWPACEELAEVDGGIGCCMMYRREVALGIGGYDPGYAPVWFDDLDLTLAIRRRGLKVLYTPEVRVVHHVGRRLELEPALRRARAHVRRRIGAALPAATRHRITQTLSIDLPPADQWQRLQHHYEYWREKWGFDMLNPDPEALRSRWGDTEICWRFNPEMRAAGEEIVARFRAHAGDPSPG